MGLMIFSVGLVIGFIHIDQHVAKQFPELLEKQNLHAVIEVTSLVEKIDGGIRFIAKPISLECDYSYLSKKKRRIDEAMKNACDGVSVWKNSIRLSLYQKYESYNLPMHDIKVGDIWAFDVRLKKPRGLVNNSGFDYQGWLLQNDIYATGYIHPKNPISIVAKRESRNFSFAVIREKLHAAIIRVGEATPNSRFFHALLYGNKGYLTIQDWETMRSTGTIHLMSISGLHVGIAALFGFIIGRMFALFVLFFDSRKVQLFNRKYLVGIGHRWLVLLPALFSIAFAYFYSGLAGFSLPTVRALTMVVVFACLFIYGRACLLPRVLTVAAIIVIAVDPFAFLSTGFWLSFLAVWLIFSQSSSFFKAHSEPQNPTFLKSKTHLLENNNLIKRCLVNAIYVSVGMVRKIAATFMMLLRMQLKLSIGLIIPLVIIGQEVSWTSPIANLIFVPLVSFFIVPLLFLWAILHLFIGEISIYAFTLADFIFNIGWRWSEYLHAMQNDITQILNNSIKMQAWLYLPKSTWMTFSLISVFLAFYFFKQKQLRFASVGLLLLVLFTPKPVDYSFRLSVLDVGQGLSVLLENRSHSILFDAGAHYSKTFDIGANVVSPILINKNISRLDALFISHADSDHAGGMNGLIKNVTVNSVIPSYHDYFSVQKILDDSPAKAPKQLVSKNDSCFTGRKWHYSDVKIEAIWPDLNDSDGLYTHRNNRSCVLLVRFFDKTILLTGDITSKVEKRLLAEGRLPKNIDVLVAAHHGSHSSSSWDFVSHVSPIHVIYSTGYKNRYNHPAKKVTNRFIKTNAIEINTAVAGAAVFEFSHPSEQAEDSSPQDSDKLRVTRMRVAREKLWF